MPKKRILIVYATAGAGHKKAALSIKKAFDEMGDAADVEIMDSLDHMSAFFKWTYPNFYIFLVSRAPFLWGLGYYVLDNRFFYGLTSWIRHLTNWAHSRRLARFLREKKYDVIISTHFLDTDVISMEGKKRIGSLLINVVTDFRLHSFWVASAVDIYVVAHEKAKKDFIEKYGVAKENVKVLGIPVDPVFARDKGIAALSEKLGLDREKFTVLIGSGGFGVGPVLELVKAFDGISIPVELLVVCGKNESLRASIEEVSRTSSVLTKVYGFVDNMDELMTVSDVIVTKTGGMMSSEALAKGLPIVGIASIPGQETRNFKILIESGVALEGKCAAEVPAIIERLYKDKGLMDGIKERIKAIEKPNASRDIARLALEVER